jgi:hypothetical protein
MAVPMCVLRGTGGHSAVDRSISPSSSTSALCPAGWTDCSVMRGFRDKTAQSTLRLGAKLVLNVVYSDGFRRFGVTSCLQLQDRYFLYVQGKAAVPSTDSHVQD